MMKNENVSYHCHSTRNVNNVKCLNEIAEVRCFIVLCFKLFLFLLLFCIRVIIKNFLMLLLFV